MFKLLKEKNIGVLVACQVLFVVTLMMGITVTGLVGHMLADDKGLATLPAGFFALTAIFITRPVSVFMQKYGRRAGFWLGALAGVIGGAICIWSIFRADFYLFCFGNVVLGAFQAIGFYFRLAAADGLPPEKRAPAISMVMTGGIIAALLTPTLVVNSKDLFSPVTYAGSFLVVVAISILLAFVIMLLQEQKLEDEGPANAGRPMREIAKQPVFIMAVVNAGVAQGVMVLIMLSTPIAMQACNFALPETANVIQWHVLGMFVPSFFSGHLVSRYGAPTIALTGVAILCASIAIAAAGIDYMNFGIALILLGIGWNFMFVSGSTMVTFSHRPEERGRVQGASEMVILTVAAFSSFISGYLLNAVGWVAVNLGAAPLLLIAAVITWRYAGLVKAEEPETVKAT